eukprot:jgi/Tetstr1/436724/TSEL_025507.t1
MHAFRTSTKASVGLEVRFDKMHAYIADMEAARHEAPADVEGPKLDGHHGIPGAGIRRTATVRDATFIGSMKDILPSFLTGNSDTNIPTLGFFDPQF